MDCLVNFFPAENVLLSVLIILLIVHIGLLEAFNIVLLKSYFSGHNQHVKKYNWIRKENSRVSEHCFMKLSVICIIVYMYVYKHTYTHMYVTRSHCKMGDRGWRTLF